jgi:integrase
VISYAVDNGVLSSDATRQVRTVTSTAAKSKERDHTRAMTRSERDHVIEATLLAAREPGLNPRTRRKRRATADLIAFLAGTGARIDEARHVRWQDINLERGRVYLRGTKSERSDRWLNLPDWLVEQLAARAARLRRRGLRRAALAQDALPFRAGHSAHRGMWLRLAPATPQSGSSQIKSGKARLEKPLKLIQCRSEPEAVKIPKVSGACRRSRGTELLRHEAAI